MCDRCEELEETVLLLKKELGADRRMPARYGLTRSQQKVVGILATRGKLTYNAASLVLWDIPPDTAEDVIRRHVHGIRAKIDWLQVQTVYGDGWEVNREMRDRLSSEMVG